MVPLPKSKESRVRKLIIPADAISPDYKILMYPYRNGSELPQTSWDDSHGDITVAWKDQQDKLTFTKNNNGSTTVSLNK